MKPGYGFQSHYVRNRIEYDSRKAQIHLQSPVRTIGAARLCTRYYLMHMAQCVKFAPPKGRTVTGNFYATVILPAIKKHYLERRPGCGLRGIKLLHDNARPHKSKQVKDKLESMRLVELYHPPYSPDLAPCDFWLFDGLKKHLAGKTFDERMQLGRTIQRYLRNIPEEEYKKTFYTWVERLKLVVKYKGDYFEHLVMF